MTALSFDGTSFSTPAGGQCGLGGVFHTTPYMAPTSGPLTLSGSVTIAPTCVPSPSPSGSPPPWTTNQLYIVGVQLPNHHTGHAFREGGGGFPNLNIYAVAGPASVGSSPWSFAALTPGLTFQAGANYEFLIVALPTPPSPQPSSAPLTRIVVPVQFDGTTFSTVASSGCGPRSPAQQPYIAPSSGPLILSGNVSIIPTCLPSPLPSNAPPLYLVAVNVNGWHHGHDAKHWGPPPPNTIVTAIAGPAGVSENPWSFAPLSPGLTMSQGQGYLFYIATVWQSRR